MSLPPMPEPEAFRFNYDGYGWSYRDNGSGSSWRDMDAPDKEFMYTADQMESYGQQCRADALREAAEVCRRIAIQNLSAEPCEGAIRNLK